MLTFLLQILSAVYDGALYLFTFLFLLVFILWVIRVLLSRRYHTWDTPYDTTTAVIIPVVDEPLDLFDAVLKRIKEQHPTEIIVVINGKRNEGLEQVCIDNNVKFTWTEIPGKRNAIVVGLDYITSEIAVLVDSDTVWTPNTLRELVKPFRDPKIGGVTTQQHILEPERNKWTRWAEWLESVRNMYSMPAMSVLGTVGCLPGRTIALRRSIIEKNKVKFMTDKFLGVHLEVSDDRTLTNYALIDGYKTVYQESSIVYTDAPTKLKVLAKQQYRWARGSQYNTMRMMWWMIRKAPVLALFYLADILIPFLVVGAFLAWAVRVIFQLKAANPYSGMLYLFGDTLVMAILLYVFSVITSWLFAAVRFQRPIAKNPKEFWFLPYYMFLNIFLLVPIRLFGFMRSAHLSGWGTRKGGYQGEKRQNILVIVPYVITFILLGFSVWFGMVFYGG